MKGVEGTNEYLSVCVGVARDRWDTPTGRDANPLLCNNLGVSRRCPIPAIPVPFGSFRWDTPRPFHPSGEPIMTTATRKTALEILRENKKNESSDAENKKTQKNIDATATREDSFPGGPAKAPEPQYTPPKSAKQLPRLPESLTLPPAAPCHLASGATGGRCGGFLFWLDAECHIHCNACDRPPHASLVRQWLIAVADDSSPGGWTWRTSRQSATATPRPCPLCRGSLFWQPGPDDDFFCAACHEPQKILCCQAIVSLPGGRRAWRPHTDERARAARDRGDRGDRGDHSGNGGAPSSLHQSTARGGDANGPTHSPAGIPLTEPEHNQWWEANARRSDALHDMQVRREAGVLFPATPGK